MSIIDQALINATAEYVAKKRVPGWKGSGWAKDYNRATTKPNQGAYADAGVGPLAGAALATTGSIARGIAALRRRKKKTTTGPGIAPGQYNPNAAPSPTTEEVKADGKTIGKVENTHYGYNARTPAGETISSHSNAEDAIAAVKGWWNKQKRIPKGKQFGGRWTI